MALISLRDVTNKTGITFNAGSLDTFYAEDYSPIKDTLQSAGSEFYMLGGSIIGSLFLTDLNHIKVVNGSGGTDIQNAIDTLPSTGGTVFLPPGSYILDNQRIDFNIGSNNINFMGAGMDSTFITCTDQVNVAELILIGSAQNVTLQNFTIDGNGANQTTYTDGFTVHNQSRNCILENLKVQNCYTNGGALKGQYHRVKGCIFDSNCVVGSGNDNFGIWGQHNIVTNCVSINITSTLSNGFGIFSNDNTAGNILLSNCTTFNCNGGYNIERIGSGVSLVNCASYGDNTALGINRTAGSPDSVVIDGCVFMDWTSATGISATYAGVTISNCLFKTLTAESDAINFSSGSDYNAIIQGNQIEVPGHGIDIITGSFSRFKIDNNSIYAGSYCMVIRGNDHTITNNTLVGSRSAMWTRDGASNIVFSGNRIHGTQIADPGDGLYFWDLSNGSHNNWIITNNIIDNCIGRGIRTAGIVGFIINNNIIKDNTQDGIYMFGENIDTIFNNNRLTDNGSYGIRLIDTSDNNIIMGNIIKGNTTGQLSVTGSNNEILGNITV